MSGHPRAGGLARLFLGLLFLGLAACPAPDAPDRPPEDAPPPPPEPAADVEDGLGERSAEERLLLIEEVPLGLTYAGVRSRLPAVGPPAPEGPETDGNGLAEAVLDTRVLGREARLELNFRDDTLYSFYYMLDAPSCEEARGLYDRLQAFYAGHFGSPRQESLTEPGYRAHSSFWTAPDFAVVATLGEQAGRCRLGWGFQDREP